MSEHNFKNFWCIFTPDGNPMPETIRHTYENCIEDFIKPFATRDNFETSNYTCKKVNVKIEKV